jgi:hypothetical protein
VCLREELLPMRAKYVTKIIARCATCGGAFGLIRHRLALKQFCSKRCLEHYRANGKQETFKLVDLPKVSSSNPQVASYSELIKRSG